MIVLKFGGAALADEAAIRHAASIVARSPRCAVVTSAMAGVTDRLVAVLAQPDEGHVATALEALHAQHAPVAAALGAQVDDILEQCERLLYGIASTQEVTPRLHDLVLSMGERLSSRLLAAALTASGHPATALDAASAGVKSLGPFGRARPDLDAQATAIPAAVAACQGTAVITGFYGVDEAGHPTLFGRGGSDFVAALVARALQADVLELWKDVDGFMTADPRAVPAAKHVAELDHDEAAELAYFGAKVLHPRCVEPLRDVGIPIHVRPLHDPDGPGTRIHLGAEPAPQRVRSAASRDGLAIVRLSGPGMADTPGVAKRVFGALEDVGIPIMNLANSQATFALLIDDERAVAAEMALQPLIGGSIQSVDILRDRALVCVVGRGLGDVPGSAARILAAVSQAGVSIEMISLGASDIAIDFIVRAKDRETALRGIHAEFLEVP